MRSLTTRPMPRPSWPVSRTSPPEGIWTSAQTRGNRSVGRSGLRPPWQLPSLSSERRRWRLRWPSVCGRPSAPILVSARIWSPPQRRLKLQRPSRHLLHPLLRLQLPPRRLQLPPRRLQPPPRRLQPPPRRPQLPPRRPQLPKSRLRPRRLRPPLPQRRSRRHRRQLPLPRPRLPSHRHQSCRRRLRWLPHQFRRCPSR